MSWSAGPWAAHYSAGAGCAHAWHEETVGGGKAHIVGRKGVYLIDFLSGRGACVL